LSLCPHCFLRGVEAELAHLPRPLIAALWEAIDILGKLPTSSDGQRAEEQPTAFALPFLVHPSPSWRPPTRQHRG
jgi:hypothetical protein